jgi:hypothetical protein
MEASLESIHRSCAPWKARPPRSAGGKSVPHWAALPVWCTKVEQHWAGGCGGGVLAFWQLIAAELLAGLA